MADRAPRRTRVDQVLAWLRDHGGSATLEEIAEGLGQPFYKHRTLFRRLKEELKRPEPRLRREGERWTTQPTDS